MAVSEVSIFFVAILVVTHSKPTNKTEYSTETIAGLHCAKYERSIRNHEGDWKCLPNATSCIDTINYIDEKCSNNPCLDFKASCQSAVDCFVDPCRPCSALYYDVNLDKVCFQPMANKSTTMESDSGSRTFTQ
ncbi:hypothetical protein M3Y95_00436300 [Aphelenchoides besseyi]|nr:hypothetical protein M3Y95_00436300 [Aphelenchoides besseyi]